MEDLETVRDLFSRQAESYALFRPVYPAALYEFLYSITGQGETAWDCATGNGQVAVQLSKHFRQVVASDISEAQLRLAPVVPNVSYTVCRAEQTPFATNSFDLVTVGTALHWLEFDAFYEEVRRVARPGACLAAWTYVPFVSTPAIDEVAHDFLENTLGGYWHERRRYLMDGYRSIPFPFREIPAPEFQITVEWTQEQFMGYVASWSAVQEFKNRHHTDPLRFIAEKIEAAWGNAPTHSFIFPLYLRVGKIG